jgi:PAS domain S-box-containing protein
MRISIKRNLRFVSFFSITLVSLFVLYYLYAPTDHKLAMLAVVTSILLLIILLLVEFIKKRALNSLDDLHEREETNQFLDAIIENIPNMVFVKDAKDLRFIRFNKAGEDLLGRSKEELIGKNDHDFFAQKEADFFTQKDREVLANGEILDIPEEPIHTANQGVRLLHTKKIPIKDSNGNALFLLGISEDITDRNKAEQAIATQREQLEGILNNTSAVIYLKKADGSYLLINRRYAELFNIEQNEVVGRTDYDMFPKEMADAFRKNDLEVIDNDKVTHIEEIAPHPDGQQSLDYVTDAAQRMSQLIRDLMQFSRISKQDLTREAVDFNELMTNVLDNLQFSIQEKAAQVTCDALPTLQCSKTLMTQVLQNLIGNAIKYIPNDVKSKVHLSATQENKMWIFSVQDNGIGIDEKFKHKIFDSFLRLHGQTEYPGTGMGLAICKRIVERHDGKIWVDSVEGKGSKFSFSLHS